MIDTLTLGRALIIESFDEAERERMRDRAGGPRRGTAANPSSA
jgi:hypothetical protein